MSTDLMQAELARALAQSLWQTGIAYGNPPRLWRVSPRWFKLWPKQWNQVLEFGKVLPMLRRTLDNNDGATYLRADFTIERRGNPVLLELNGVPV